MPKTCEYTIPTYRDRAIIQQDSSNQDVIAEDFTGTPFAANVPCNILTMSGDEKYRGESKQAEITHIVETPWREGVKSTMRLVVTGGIYDGQILNIELVQPRRKGANLPFLALHCKEVEA